MQSFDVENPKIGVPAALGGLLGWVWSGIVDMFATGEVVKTGPLLTTPLDDPSLSIGRRDLDFGILHIKLCNLGQCSPKSGEGAAVST